MRAIPLILLILVAGLTPAQDKLVAKPTEDTVKDNGSVRKSPLTSPLEKLRASFKAVMALGKPGASPLGKLRRKQKVKTAVSVMRLVSTRLRKAPKPENASEPEEVQKICETFSADLAAVVVLGEKVLDDLY